MHRGTGRVVELVMEDGCRYGHLTCAEKLIPAPGQYLLASDGSNMILPVPVFYTDSAPNGFIGPVPDRWIPGETLYLRGPLGRGFSLPPSARRIGLVALDGPFSRLRGLIQPALRQNASVVLITAWEPGGLPDEVEVQPVSALGDIFEWADYIAVDLEREDLPKWRQKLGERVPRPALPEVQILIHTSMPCGGIAECGVCALRTEDDWKLICKEGPVFDLREI
ncbi:MAG TPA: hypothetical protein VFY26_20155 [Anaerolineales bacterium]|nr:hypothetical protein [Anaerolineales bacterium]